MIDFAAASIPVFINNGLSGQGSGLFMYGDMNGMLLTCRFNILSTQNAKLIAPPFYEYLRQNQNFTHGVLECLKQGRFEDALKELKERHEERAAQGNSNLGSFPQNFTPDNIVQTGITVCRIFPTTQNETVFFPCNAHDLARAFTISAHKGTLVSIDVDRSKGTSQISTFMPSTKSANMKAHPHLG